MTTKREAQRVLREVFGERVPARLPLSLWHRSARSARATYYGEGKLFGYRVWYFVAVHRLAPPIVWVTVFPVPGSKSILYWDPWISGESRSLSQLYFTEADITARVLHAMR